MADFFSCWSSDAFLTGWRRDVSENHEIIANFPVSTCVVTCYIEGPNCALGKLRSLAAVELVAHQKWWQTDMVKAPDNFAETVKEVRQHLGLGQEELGVSFSPINRWENSKTVPFKLARRQFEAFCKRMAAQGKLKRDNKATHS